jgi:hypothetical protein
MVRTTLLLTTLLLFTACMTRHLDVQQIRNLNKIPFEPLSLRPGWEVDPFRIDVIRQTETETDTDSTSSTVDVPHHPAGFYLGNGLFMDLNHNLSLLMPYFLQLDTDAPFLLEEGPPNGVLDVKQYRFSGDSLTYTTAAHKRTRHVYDRRINADTVHYNWDNTLYRVVQQDTQLVVQRGKRGYVDIVREGEDAFRYQQRRPSIYRRESAQGLNLADEYLVWLSDDQRTISILQKPRRKAAEPTLLYTIERSQDTVMVYNRRFYGLQLARTADGTCIVRQPKICDF